jgi:hypothetical protein
MNAVLGGGLSAVLVEREGVGKLDLRHRLVRIGSVEHEALQVQQEHLFSSVGFRFKFRV